MIGSIAALFVFTVRQTLWQKKIWLTVLLLCGPCALTLLMRTFAPARLVFERFHGPLLFYLFYFVIPLVCMLYGTALIGAEAESRTLVYLLTRRLRRATVLLVRYVATVCVLTGLFELAVLADYYCAVGGVDVEAVTGRAWSPLLELGGYLYVVPLAVASFLAVFTLIGLITSRALTFSIAYIVLVELIMGNLPVGVQSYTVSRHLRATLFAANPRLTTLFDINPETLKLLYPPGSSGLGVLLVLSVLALAIACLAASVRELLPAKVARD